MNTVVEYVSDVPILGTAFVASVTVAHVAPRLRFETASRRTALSRVPKNQSFLLAECESRSDIAYDSLADR